LAPVTSPVDEVTGTRSSKLGAWMVVTVVAVMMAGLCERRTSKQHNHGE
jgi:hypothetical protein